MGELYDPIKAKAITQGFNGATGSQGVQTAAANLTGTPKTTTAIDRRLALTKNDGD